MNFEGLRIGYAPYSYTLNRPGDRRRFCYYAYKRDLNFEIANPCHEYDIVVVTEQADLSLWSQYRSAKRKIIFELTNSYLAAPKNNIKSQLRGLARFGTGRDSKLRLNYWKTLEDMCSYSDAVICSTREQQENINLFCSNVHIILDFQSEVIQSIKKDYSTGETINLIWEGLGNNVSTLKEISEILYKLNKKYKIALHLLTDIEYSPYMNKFGKRSNLAVAKKIFNNIYLYQWNSLLASNIITACDLAIIPLPLDDPFISGKPENKLLLFWRMAMPTIVSATPAYARAMQESGLNLACKTLEEWEEKLETLIISKQAREEAGRIGLSFVNNCYSDKKILEQWDNVFKSVFD